MSVLSIRAFFQYFIYHPNSGHLTPAEKTIVAYVRLFLASISLTILPRLCQWKWSQQNIWNMKEREIIFNRIRQTINSAPSDTLGTENKKNEEKKASKIPCHRIVHGLHLGNSEAFAHATSLEFNHPNEFGKPVSIKTTNPVGFQKIVTLCPMKSIAGDFDGLAELGVEMIAKSLADQRIEWLNIGRTVVDDASGWLPLVHDCTYPKSQEAQKELDMNAGMPMEEFKALGAMKTKKMQGTAVTAWFEPVFAAIDTAIFNETPVLVHCQAGVSRSATVVAAYLINRFQVKAYQAHGFLKSERYCVNSKFWKQLMEYQSKLDQETKTS